MTATPAEGLVEAPGGVRLATRTWADGGDFLLVHGLASNARLWDGVAEELAARGFGSIAVDQRGHGRSDKPGIGFDFATLTDDLAVAVGEVGPVVAVGQSWGGNVVLELAARHPELISAVVGVDGGFIRLGDRFPDEGSMLDALAPPRLDGMSVEDLEAHMHATLGDWPPSGIAGQLGNFEVLEDRTVRARLSRDDHLAILSALWRHDPYATVEQVEVPWLVIAVPGSMPGKDSAVEAFVARSPFGSAVWLDGHHDIHAQQPRLVCDVILEFLEKAL